MSPRTSGLRDALIQAGIYEINANGVASFSIRRVAEACGVSCAAPYRHFESKRDFIAAIIDYVNDQWAARQEEILAGAGESLREQIIAICVGYVRFLMDAPTYRSILMLKDEEFDNIYHKSRGQMSSRSQRLEAEFFAVSGWDQEKMKRKLHIVRALLFGTVFMIETGELAVDDQVLDTIRMTVDREFDLA